MGEGVGKECESMILGGLKVLFHCYLQCCGFERVYVCISSGWLPVSTVTEFHCGYPLEGSFD